MSVGGSKDSIKTPGPDSTQRPRTNRKGQETSSEWQEEEIGSGTDQGIYPIQLQKTRLPMDRLQNPLKHNQKTLQRKSGPQLEKKHTHDAQNDMSSHRTDLTCSDS